MKSFGIIVIFIFHLTAESFCQIAPGARQIAVAHADVALSDDVFAIFNNPAGLAQLSKLETGIFYSPSPFDVKELATGFAAISLPAKFGVLSAGFMFFGFNLYQENKISLSYSRKLFDNFSAGITANYHNLKIEKYGSDYSVSLDLGGIAKLNDNIQIGFSAKNISRATFGSESNQIPSELWFGVMFKPAEPLNTYFALQKDLDYDPSLRFGIEYRIIEYLALRSGFNNYPSTYNFGIGVFLKIFEFDYALFTHHDLGLTHQAGLIIRFDNK